MARVVAFVPDLLFGSNVVGGLTAGGHEAVLVSDAGQLAAGLSAADVVIVDLTDDVDARIATASGALASDGVRTLAFFSHVEDDVKRRATEAGFDLVVPRSRMARATAQLVDQLTG